MSTSDVVGLPPIVGGRPTVLILGNAPGVLSLATQQYYGNPRNGFWRIAGELFGFDPAAEYATRTAALVERGVAVWDVLRFCRRVGSLDAAVERDSMQANDFASFFTEHPSIERVFFTGSAAMTNYRRLVRVDAHVTYVRLPSTSPAHTMTLERKLELWRQALGCEGRHTPV
jgi:hypoxanthine-DNA glycosylase